MQLYRAPVDLVALVDEAVQAVRPLLETSAIAVELAVPPRLSALVDAQRIRQVLDKISSNAVKYSNAGGRVPVALRPGEDGIEIAVSDDGMGMSEDEVKHAFDRFFRGRAARERCIPGTGLGLNIVHSIVSAHGGLVTLESGVGRGSTFRITLPTRDE